MMRIIFSNLTEKKNVPAFNFFLSVNEQFQESFLWDKGGGWTYTGNQTKKSTRKTTLFFWNRFWLSACKRNTNMCVSSLLKYSKRVPEGSRLK